MTVAASQAEAFKAGVHPGISFAEYAAWDALNWHKLYPYRVSAKHGRYQELKPDDSTDNQVFHAAFHAAILEPAAFDADFAVMPKFDGHPSSNVYKEAKANWISANERKVHISTSDRNELLAMQASVRAHPVASAMLAAKPGRNELSMLWQDRETKLWCKGRADRFARVKVGIIDPAAANPEASALCLIDIKGTRAIDSFDREFGKYAYHGQLAFYKDGLETIDPRGTVHPYVLAVENQPPYDVIVFRVDEAAIEEGRKLYRKLINRRAACERVKRWPGISDAVRVLFLPDWCKEPDTAEEA